VPTPVSDLTLRLKAPLRARAAPAVAAHTKGSTLHKRPAILSIVAVLSLSAAGYAAASGRPPGGHGRPSTTPPPWSHGHGQGDSHGSSGKHGGDR
jgi:hypothetical protein